MTECFCDVNAYALKGTCECEENCTCECEVCECDSVDLWYVDVQACACGGNCKCGQPSDETS